MMRYSEMPSRRNYNVQISRRRNLPFNYFFDSTELIDACSKGTPTLTFKSHSFAPIIFHSFYDIF